MRQYPNIGCVHYDMNNMTEVIGNCKVTYDEIRKTLKSYTKDMDYLLSMHKNLRTKV